MGQIFLAREVALERLVAVKVLKRELADDAIARARFQREALAAARIAHPNVATIYRVGERADGVPYIAQEYIEGRNLAEMLRMEGPCSVVECRYILRNIAQALSAADTKRVVHRDVTPKNVLLERDTRRVVLTDFGIAGLQETGRAIPRLTRTGELLGDPSYASPEVIRGESLTAASDIYSLGVLGYELLLGRGPYDVAEIYEITQAHIAGTPIDLTTARSDVPPAVAELLLRCLAKKPENRPTATELVRLLANETTPELPVHSALTSSISNGVANIRPSSTQKRMLRLIVAVATVTAISVLMWWLLRR